MIVKLNMTYNQQYQNLTPELFDQNYSNYVSKWLSVEYFDKQDRFTATSKTGENWVIFTRYHQDISLNSEYKNRTGGSWLYIKNQD